MCIFNLWKCKWRKEHVREITQHQSHLQPERGGHCLSVPWYIQRYCFLLLFGGNVMNLSVSMTQPEENPGVAERSCYQTHNWAYRLNYFYRIRIQQCKSGVANTQNPNSDYNYINSSKGLQLVCRWVPRTVLIVCQRLWRLKCPVTVTSKQKLLLYKQDRGNDNFANVLAEWRSIDRLKEVLQSQQRDHWPPGSEATLWKVHEASFLCEEQLGSECFLQLQWWQEVCWSPKERLSGCPTLELILRTVYAGEGF